MERVESRSPGPDLAGTGPADVDATEIRPAELCDVCGGPVAADEAVKAELSAADAMCPTPMTMHQACYEQASQIWQPDPDSYCTTDPDFPETQQWTTPPSAAQQAGS